MDGKTKAIVAHIFFVGWIIAFVLNLNDKEEFTSFFIRQTLLLHVMVLIGWIPFFGWFFWIAGIILLVISLVSAINEEKKEIPFVGSYFQDWFKSF
ncbi:MAG: hypothetical protein JXR31_04695 [Prolixibacteraceae bacterium]|nr:hypothetical protein [Prolixibacteraceae bacterium]MBN2773523.1 hypothetical protein [Prolixibacteraceae bacterium]